MHAFKRKAPVLAFFLVFQGPGGLGWGGGELVETSFPPFNPTSLAFLIKDIWVHHLLPFFFLSDKNQGRVAQIKGGGGGNGWIYTNYTDFFFFGGELVF